MALWSKTGALPKWLSRVAKRKIIATEQGFVRRVNYTDIHGRSRSKDEIIAVVPGVANSTNMGSPSIQDLWYSANPVVHGNPVTISVTFDEPIGYLGTAGKLKIAVANTAGGASGLSAVSSTTIYGANNEIRFSFTPSTAGTYKVQAQTASNGSATTVGNLKSLNSGNEAVSLVISGTVSNTAGSLTVT